MQPDYASLEGKRWSNPPRTILYLLTPAFRIYFLPLSFANLFKPLSMLRCETKIDYYYSYEEEQGNRGRFHFLNTLRLSVSLDEGIGIKYHR